MNNPDLETHIAQARANIDQLLAQGNIEEANKKSYNLSADLAECWPGDDRPRELRHFELGRELAERCLGWREQLARGPRPFAIAHWVRGMHLLSLATRSGDRGMLAAAIASFERSVTAAVAAAAEAGAVDRVAPEGDYLVILNSGFLGLARELAVPGTGRPLIERACECFVEQARLYPDRAEDARYGLENLQVVVQRFLR